MIATLEELLGALSADPGSQSTEGLAAALLKLGLVDRPALLAAARQAKALPGLSLADVLVRLGLVTGEQIRAALACKVGVPLVDVKRFPADPQALRLLPLTAAVRLNALALTIISDSVVVAVEGPAGQQAAAELRRIIGRNVVVVLAARGDIRSVIKDRYFMSQPRVWSDSTMPASLDAPGDFRPTDAGTLVETLEHEGRDEDDAEDVQISQVENSLVQLINQIIVEAHAQSASDIHFECPGGRERVRVRFRKDGVLNDHIELPSTHRRAVVARLKIMCGLDIAEQRLPQDGKIDFARFSPAHRVELRVATIPTSGRREDVVIRILSSAKPVPLDRLDVGASNLERIKRVVAQPYGLILCVGPTGSGKTTTIHALLAHVNTPDRKIWTAEDPVEITHQGLRQVQVNSKIDWTFARALRAFLRADPDVIMLGEVRDAETARMAIEASLTGHLVLSTLHTNSAAETITRLLDMGMDPFTFGDSLLAVLAQRLVRRLCPKCRRARPATGEEQSALMVDYLRCIPVEAGRECAAAAQQRWAELAGRNGKMQVYESVGCPDCGRSGFRGRVALHELLVVVPELRTLIQSRARSETIKAAAQAGGMYTLRQDGIEKVLLGLARIDDVRGASNV
ncbi:GspE/PulE family protein [Piscinibacter sp.]|uniref:GspE/PulE family protein n=1 Tax=Piscinibacter sp. TaxID=1903157 RepID=UPI002C2DD08B|nr:GspE/PulE family protein [Albitalea sp.]HUG22718.1 GspE/PulE family protein [Albitalea sp.]